MCVRLPLSLVNPQRTGGLEKKGQDGEDGRRRRSRADGLDVLYWGWNGLGWAVTGECWESKDEVSSGSQLVVAVAVEVSPAIYSQKQQRTGRRRGMQRPMSWSEEEWLMLG